VAKPSSPVFLVVSKSFKILHLIGELALRPSLLGASPQNRKQQKGKRPQKRRKKAKAEAAADKADDDQADGQ